ncbi:hypothetical protein [Streptomyces afghaniensis]|uniref:hypothetical protein n=1 Tax=Streptomyces afghaniensis TaxID=66865 RepID=UPI0027D8325A|nr:hypothetical protein [Streptomyces afghaniensis]
MAELTRYHKVLTDHHSVIRTALWGYVERMEKAAKEAEDEYKAGQADPEVKARQDASYMTNRGYKHAAALFSDSAKSGREALEDLMNAELGPEEDEDTEQG